MYNQESARGQAETEATENVETEKDVATGQLGPEQVYTSSEVARISGVSLRQLQWWDERNVVSPSQQGHRRVYLPSEVVEVSVIAALRKKGFSLQKIRRVLRFLQKEMNKRLADAAQGKTDIHLLTDGKNIYLEDQPDRIIDVMKNAKQPMFLVCVSDQLRRIHLGTERKPAANEIAGAERKTRTARKAG